MKWRFSTCHRLVDLIERCQSTAEYLRRDRCDQIGNPAALETIDRRLAIIRGRTARLQTEARRARRANRLTYQDTRTFTAS